MTFAMAGRQKQRNSTTHHCALRTGRPRNFCVVVDDADMGVTHVIRGDDHLNNTPRQMNMLLALGKQPPVYAHVPMILGPDGAKLSKRHGAVSVLEYQDQGYLPEALLNYLVRLGWSHGDQEYFTRDDMIAAFDVRDINKSASALNPEKMLWLNQQHLMKAQPKDVLPHLRWHLGRLGIYSQDDDFLEGIILAQRERAKTLKEMAENSRFFFGDEVILDPKAADKHLTAEAKGLLGELRTRFAAIADWAAPAVHAALEGLAKRSSRPGKWRSRCVSPSRAARCRRPSMSRWRCSARRARWRASTGHWLIDRLRRDVRNVAFGARGVDGHDCEVPRALRQALDRVRAEPGVADGCRLAERIGGESIGHAITRESVVRCRQCWSSAESAYCGGAIGNPQPESENAVVRRRGSVGHRDDDVRECPRVGQRRGARQSAGRRAERGPGRAILNTESQRVAVRIAGARLERIRREDVDGQQWRARDGRCAIGRRPDLNGERGQ